LDLFPLIDYRSIEQNVISSNACGQGPACCGVYIGGVIFWMADREK
jgi:hypothetical protein